VSFDAWLTLALLVLAVLLFISEKLPADVVALLVLSTLLVTGVLSPAQALSG
jgi:di/tricarboxylate transporter